MSDITVKQVEEIEYYQGPHAVEGIHFHTAGKDLGVSAWGMNVLVMAPHCPNYPKHDHVKDGQEEVYVVLAGSATLETADESVLLEPGTLVRVGPAVKRTLVPGEQGVTVLALGATPGQAYSTSR